MLVLISSTSVFAADNISYDIDGDLSIEEGAEPYEYSQEEIDLIKQKRSQLNNNNNNISLNSLDEGKYKVLSVPCFEQDNGYYCGPATTKQVVHYLNGSSATQAEIASELGTSVKGTTMPYIATYLNEVTNETYVYDEGITTNYSTWYSAIISSIDNEKPAILDIRIEDTTVFPYTARTGHYVNVSGYEENYITSLNRWIRITDPFGPGLGNRWYDSEDLHEVNDNHPRKAIIW